MKSGRLLEMLLLLQARGSVTAAELAHRLEVSTRTVYRDAEALSSAGVPIYAERGRGGGIRLLPGFRTDVTGLTQDEARALFVLTTGGAHADLGLAAPLRSAIAKVLQAVPAPFQPAAEAVSQRILVDPVGWMRGAEAAGSLGVLQSAVFAGRRVLLRYRSSGQASATERMVDPYGLVSKSGIWYLVADVAGEPRLFRVSRVESAVLDEAPVVLRAGVELAGLWDALRRQVDERPTPVRVSARVRRTRLDMFARMFAAHLASAPADLSSAGGAVAAGDTPGGVEGAAGGAGDAGGEWAEVSLRFAAVQAARPLLSFGADVVVLWPQEVRDDLLAVASAVTACYSAAPPAR
jgi:predicted DNA-binding transcriptional regulator YafY